MAETAEGGTEVGSGGEVGESQSSFPGAVFKSSLCHFLSSPPFTEEEGKAQKSELPKVTHPVEPGPEGSVWKPDHRLVSLIPATARYQTMER